MNENNDDLMWLVGIYEGEGCCGVTKNRKHLMPYVQISNNDMSLLYEVKRICGFGGIYSNGVKKNIMPVYDWASNKNSDVENFVKIIYPKLRSIKRKTQMLKVLDYFEERNGGGEAERE